jgi:hypothetical protein
MAIDPEREDYDDADSATSREHRRTLIATVLWIVALKG